MHDETTTCLSDLFDYANTQSLNLRTRSTLGLNNQKFLETLNTVTMSVQCIVERTNLLDWTDEEIDIITEIREDLIFYLSALSAENEEHPDYE